MRIVKLVAVGFFFIPTFSQTYADEWEGNYQISCYGQNRLEAYNVLNTARSFENIALEEQWGVDDLNDPDLRPILEKTSRLDQLLREIDVDVVNGHPFTAQNALYQVLEILNDSDLSERAYAKRILQFVYTLSDVGVEPGLTADQLKRLLTKASEHDERTQIGSNHSTNPLRAKLSQFVKQKVAYLENDIESLERILEAQRAASNNPDQQVDLAKGYLMAYEITSNGDYVAMARELLVGTIESVEEDRCQSLTMGRAATTLTVLNTDEIGLASELTNEDLEFMLDIAGRARSSFGGIDVPSYKGHAFIASSNLFQAIAPYVSPRGASAELQERAERYAEIGRSLR